MILQSSLVFVLGECVLKLSVVHELIPSSKGVEWGEGIDSWT